METSVRLASAPINWGVGPIEGAPPPLEVLAAIADAGYEGCELGTYGYFGNSADEIVPRFQEHDLAMVATWYDVDLAKPLSPETAFELRQICPILQAGGARILLISAKITRRRLEVVARVPQFPETWWSEADWAQAPQTLLEIHDLAAPYGLTTAIHPHVATHIETGQEIRRILAETVDSPVKLCLDTGHVLLGGSDPIALLKHEGHRIVHVHAKDVDGRIADELRAGRMRYEEAVGKGLYARLGDGQVDWAGLKGGLDDSGYREWVVVEQDRLPSGRSPEPVEANRRNRLFLAELFQL